MKVWTFNDDCHVVPGTEKHPGKPEWPDVLVIELDRKGLMRLLRSTVACLDSIGTDIDDEVTITLHGALKEGES
jgi:hypothetical protein